MKSCIFAIAVIVALFSGAAFSQNNSTIESQQYNINQAQGDRARVCANKYQKQHIPQDQHAAFIAKCMQPAPAAASAPMTSNELAAQNEKERSCKMTAKTRNLTGNARKSFMADCLGN